MKTELIKIALATTLLFANTHRGHAQSSFVNLDFESPLLPLVPDASFTVSITNALPGWTGYIGLDQWDRVVYNTKSLGAPAISLQGPGSLSPILQGSYTVLLQASSPIPSVFSAIAQTGTIPVGAQSLTFYSRGFVSTTAVVAFNRQQLPQSLLGGTSDTYYIWGADISRYAGQTGELLFTGSAYLDNIQFSPLPIPEPSTLGLFGIGALLLGGRLERRLRR